MSFLQTHVPSVPHAALTSCGYPEWRQTHNNQNTNRRRCEYYREQHIFTFYYLFTPLLQPEVNMAASFDRHGKLIVAGTSKGKVK